MARYSMELKTRQYIKGYGLLPVARNLCNKCGKQLFGAATKAGLDALKTATKKVVHKISDATVEFIGNKIADKIVNSKAAPDVNSRNVEKIFFPPEKRKEILNDYRQVL